MSQENVIGIQPHKAARLATELAATGNRLERTAFDLYLPLQEAMEDLDPVLRLLDAREWMAEQSSSLQRLIDEITGWWQQGHGPRDGIDLWTAPYDASFDTPVEAGRMAERARQVYLDHPDDPDASDHEGFARLAAAWGANPAFAAALAARLDPRTVVNLLLSDRDLRRAEGEPGAHRRALESVFAVVATASAFGILPFGFAALEHELLAGDERTPDPTGPNGGRNTLALLFTPGLVWDDDFLLEAVRTVVLPANAEARDRHVVQSSGDDGRTAILLAVAHNPFAASRLLIEATPVELDLLLSRAVAYEDGGQALAGVLSAAVAAPDGPIPGGPGPHAAQAMVRLVTWTAAHRDLPDLVRDRLPALVEPYLGSFRAGIFDADPAVASPLGELAAGDRRGFIDYISSTTGPRQDLRQRGIRWAAGQFAMLSAGGAGGAGIATVASVDHRIAQAAAAAEGVEAKAKDDDFARQRFVWDFIEAVVADKVDAPVASATVGTVLQQLHRALRPDPKYFEKVADNAAAREQSDRDMIQALYLGVLWANRDHNGVFTGIQPPPADLLRGDPPVLLMPPEMSPDEADHFYRWINDPAVLRATHWQELASWGQS